MRRGRPTGSLERPALLKIAGGLGALAFAAVVYSQFNLYGALQRDSAIYVYGGQRFVHGVPPYASIMDPKGPVTAILCGIGVAVARLFGRNDLLTIRVEFCALSVVSVLGIYLLVLELWHSVVAGVVAAAVFTSFSQYAADALTGPDGHTTGIVFVVFAMWLTVRRQWYWAGFAASLAFFSWQPLFTYLLVVLLCAIVWSPGRRLHAAGSNLLGAATPLAILTGYYAASGFPGMLFEGTILFPLRGTYRPPTSLGGRMSFMFHNIAASYGSSATLFWIGLALLLIAAVAAFRARAFVCPVVLLVMLSLVAQIAYVLVDYIGWTHAFPLLPYSALGFGAGAAYLIGISGGRARQVTTAALLAGSTALVAFYAVDYYQPSRDAGLLEEQASSCAVQRSLVPGTTLWVVDNPDPLVLLHRSNPDNYPYVGSGLAAWRIEHTRGGFAGWAAQIRSRASIVVFQYWREALPIKFRLKHWLSAHGYREGYIGAWHVYVTRAASARMAAQSIRLTATSHGWPLSANNTAIRFTGCTKVPAG